MCAGRAAPENDSGDGRFEDCCRCGRTAGSDEVQPDRRHRLQSRKRNIQIDLPFKENESSCNQSQSRRRLMNNSSPSMLLDEWLSGALIEGTDISERLVSIPQMGFSVNVAYGVISSSSAMLFQRISTS